MSIDAIEPTTPVGSFARAVFFLGGCLTTGTGIGLFVAPGRTAAYWAWTIKAPLSAAFFGAGYIGAALALWRALHEHEWRRTRIVAVLAFTLTSLALLETLRNLGPFAFRDGGLRETVAWIWLAVYVALPPLVLTAFVLQERAGGAREYGRELPALFITRLLLGVAGATVGVLGVALLADWRWLASRWPWSLPPLPATVVGAWFCTYAAGLLWFAVRERDWRRVRLGVTSGMITLSLDLVAAVRLRDGFEGSLATVLYLAGLATLLVTVAAVALVEGRRIRGAAELTTAAHV